jgi:thiol-disulfide isomerase/thioredoxin
MLSKVTTAITGMLLALFAGWVIANAAVGLPAPGITNPVWLNSEPLSPVSLKGKVVLVEFWTFGCYNCRNVEPYVKMWHEQYGRQGLVVIGVHSPELSHERELENVRHYLKSHNIRFAVTIDNDFSTWNKFGNRYWPAMYLIDKRGVFRYVRIGEGGYQETERLIQALLREKG